MRDRIDLWYSALNPRRYRLLKAGLRALLKGLKATFGLILVPNLSLAIRKSVESA